MSNYPDDDYDRRGDRDEDRDDDGGRGDRTIAAAKSAVMVPAIGLIFVGVVGIVIALLNLVQTGSFDEQLEAEIKKIEDNPDIPAAQKKDQVDMMKKIGEWVKVGLIPYALFIVLTSAITLVAGVKLMSLGSPGLVKFGAILSFLPCLSGCCLLGLVFGIWALVVMGKPEVKAGFAAKRRSSY